jgi:hypothetical protein
MQAMKPNDILNHFGSKAEIARTLGVELPSVCEWFDKDRVPESRQYQIELATGRKLRASKPADRRPKKRAA